jgi:predicted nucleic acid-binding protein
MYLLDTDILSNLMKRSPSSVLVEKLTRVPPDQQFTSSITLGELVYGARRLRERTDVLMAKIKGVLLPNMPMLAFDARSWSARRFGRSDAVPPITVLLSTFVCAVTYTRCRGVRLE